MFSILYIVPYSGHFVSQCFIHLAVVFMKVNPGTGRIIERRKSRTGRNQAAKKNHRDKMSTTSVGCLL
jgi:hypothetical protein